MDSVTGCFVRVAAESMAESDSDPSDDEEEAEEDDAVVEEDDEE